MKGKSHQLLGQYLVDRYMEDAPSRHIRAFLFGCIEPDRNPATYLKGSLHRQWLRGHNWGNSQTYMRRVAARLENRKKMRLLDYYSLGKLIHYTTDAFTYAHNPEFPSDLKEHNEYERNLQDYFLENIEKLPALQSIVSPSVMDTIHSYHKEYRHLPRGIHSDARYAVAVCCSVLAQILANPLLLQKSLA